MKIGKWLCGIVLAANMQLANTCTLDNPYEEVGGANIYLAVMETVKIVTGKEFEELNEGVQKELLERIWRSGALGGTHVITDSGELDGVEHLLREVSLPAGSYRIYDAEEEADLVKLSFRGVKDLWMEENSGCYSLSSYDTLKWNGYSGELCDSDAEDEDDEC